MDPPAIVIRPLASGERRALATVMRRSFGGLAGVVFSSGKTTFVAVAAGRLVGGAVVGTFPIDGARRGGIVKWLFTLPEARGSGVASALLDRALAWFDEQGVTDAFACIEALNAASSNRFARRGFAPLGFAEQLRRFGARLPRVWWHANHVVDVGHVLWHRGAAEGIEPGRDAAERARGLGGLAATLALHAAFAALLLLRRGADVDPSAWVPFLLAPAVVVGVRTAAMALAGAGSGVVLRYRPWETGLLLAGAIAGLFGGPFVAPGSMTLRARAWSPRSLEPLWVRMAFAGAIATVALAVLAAWGVAAGVATSFAGPVSTYARILATFDVLLPFVPMTAFSGRRMWAASRVGWAALAAIVLALWAASPGA